MTDQQIIKILLDALREYIEPVIKGTPYKLSEIVGLVMREYGHKVARELKEGKDIKHILTNAKGDYRNGRYHGFSPFQIDIGSFPEWINAGHWQSLMLSSAMCIKVLEEKRAYLKNRGWNKKLSIEKFRRSVFAAYNCGQGNVHKALSHGADPDRYTFNHDYSAEVMRFAGICQEIINEQSNGFYRSIRFMMDRMKDAKLVF